MWLLIEYNTIVSMFLDWNVKFICLILYCQHSTYDLLNFVFKDTVSSWIILLKHLGLTTPCANQSALKVTKACHFGDGSAKCKVVPSYLAQCEVLTPKGHPTRMDCS